MNIAKINLEVARCLDCPYCHKPDGYPAYHCTHDLHNPGIEVGEGEVIPDFCPFVLERLEKMLKKVADCPATTIPKKYIAEIGRRQKDDPDPKFGADHAWDHVKRVVDFGDEFLEHCVAYGYLSSDSVQKEKILFKMAAYMHDIGLADTKMNHAIHSAGLAERFLMNPKNDISEEDVHVIVHAICNHSEGRETRTLTDAVLLISDKVDMTKERVNRVMEPILAEMLKIERVDFRFVGKNGKAKRAELCYFTDKEKKFDVLSLKKHPRFVSVPMRVALDYFRVPEFRFLVDGKLIDVKQIIG